MSKRQVPGWVWAVLVAAHLVAFSWALSTARWDFPDSGRYRQAAENLQVWGQLYARPWPRAYPVGQAVQEFTIRPPGYPLVVLGLGAATGAPVLLLVLQNVLSLLNCGLVLGWWARWISPTRKGWWLALAAILSFPAQLIYANAVMSEMLLQSVVLVMAMATMLYIDTTRYKYATWAAVMVIAAWLLKPVFYPLGFLAAGGASWLAWRRRQGALAVLGLLPVLLVVAYMGWNSQRTGYFHFSSITDINLLHYNAAGVVRQVAGAEAEERWVGSVLQAANEAPTFAARQRLVGARAAGVLWAHPVVYARQHLQGMAAFFLDPGRFDLSEFLGMPPLARGGLLAQARAGGLLRAVMHLPVGLLAWLAVVLLANVARLSLAVKGFVRLGEAGALERQGRWVAVGLLLYVAVLTGPLGATRFLVPVWPLLLALVLAGLQGRAVSASGCGAAKDASG